MLLCNVGCGHFYVRWQLALFELSWLNNAGRHTNYAKRHFIFLDLKLYLKFDILKLVSVLFYRDLGL